MLFEEIWKWNEAKQRLEFDRKVTDDGEAARADRRLVELVDEAARWRRMYEQQWEISARLRNRIEQLEGRK